MGWAGGPRATRIASDGNSDRIFPRRSCRAPRRFQGKSTEPTGIRSEHDPGCTIHPSAASRDTKTKKKKACEHIDTASVATTKALMAGVNVAR